MRRDDFFTLEFRELTAIRRQAEREEQVFGFRLTECGLVPVDPDSPDCDVAIGRSAVYVYGHDRAAGAQLVRNLSARPQPEGLLRHLAKLPEFESLDDAQLAQLAEHAIRRKHGPGTEIVREGEDGHSLFVLVEGTARVIAKGSETAARSVAVLQPGACFGEMSLLTGTPRNATVKADSACVTYEIDKDHLRPLLESQGSFVEALSALMAQRRIAQMQREYFESCMQADESRLAQSFAAGLRRFFGLPSAAAPQTRIEF